MNNIIPYQRIVIVGTTGSGKSTIANQLAEIIGADNIELDALHWGQNWAGAKPEVFRERVEKAISSDVWVVAGNYHVVRDLIWSKAQAIIWLDYPFHIVFWRLLTRTIRRAVTQEELWNGNRETFWMHLKLWSQDSLFHWLFKTYWRRKYEYPILFSLPEYEHLHVLHFRSTTETKKWIKELQ